ncbi:MAG: hypothetical protein AB1763_04795 [Campylobacterota bacterium]
MEIKITTDMVLPAPKTLDQLKDDKLQELRDAFNSKSLRPRVDTGLGYYVDGSYADLRNFEIGQEFGLQFIKDADGADHPATAGDYDLVIAAIKQHGLDLYQWKWAKGQEIAACTTEAAINAVVI